VALSMAMFDSRPMKVRLNVTRPAFPQPEPLPCLDDELFVLIQAAMQAQAQAPVPEAVLQQSADMQDMSHTANLQALLTQVTTAIASQQHHQPQVFEDMLAHVAPRQAYQVPSCAVRAQQHQQVHMPAAMPSHECMQQPQEMSSYACRPQQYAQVRTEQDARVLQASRSDSMDGAMLAQFTHAALAQQAQEDAHEVHRVQRNENALSQDLLVQAMASLAKHQQRQPTPAAFPAAAPSQLRSQFPFVSPPGLSVNSALDTALPIARAQQGFLRLDQTASHRPCTCGGNCRSCAGEYRTSQVPAPSVSIDTPSNRAQTHSEDNVLHLTLSKEDPLCVFATRRINKLGFKSKSILKHHFSGYGEVLYVLWPDGAKQNSGANGGSQIRVRAANLAFVVMKAAEAVQTILAEGSEHTVKGVQILLSRYEPKGHCEEGASLADIPAPMQVALGNAGGDHEWSVAMDLRKQAEHLRAHADVLMQAAQGMTNSLPAYDHQVTAPLPAGLVSGRSELKQVKVTAQDRSSANSSDAFSLRSHLTQVSSEDPRCIFVVRHVHKLGFHSDKKLRKYYSSFGEVVHVLVADKKNKPFPGSDGERNKRPGSLGLIVMKSPHSVQQILAAGMKQDVAGHVITIEAFNIPNASDFGSCSDDTSTHVPSTGLGSGSGEGGSGCGEAGSNGDSEDSDKALAELLSNPNRAPLHL